MSDDPNRLKSLREKIEPIVWLVGSVLVPVVGGLLFVWSAFISPKIQEFGDHLKSDVTAELSKQLQEFRQKVDNAEKSHVDAIDSIKHKIEDELDSTYYFTQSYQISYPSSETNGASEAEIDAGPLSQFFYAADNDDVRLFIWTEGRGSAAMKININGGKDLFLTDFKSTTWTNIDITPNVKASDPLTDETYRGIGRNIYFITITPIPAKLPQPRNVSLKHSVAAIPKHDATAPGEPAAQPSPQSALAGELDLDKASVKQKATFEMNVYALVIVRRSHFK